MERKNPTNLKELIQEEYLSIAELPEKNEISEGELDNLDGYTVPLVGHDYGAKTPLMWNSLYESLGLNLRNIMVVANSRENSAEMIINTLRSDPKYLGGGFGVGWKERMDLLDEVRPDDLGSVNLVVKENGKLIGYNTDAEGFVRSLEEKFNSIGKKIDGSNIVLLGAGGVAKEVAERIASKKANRIVILNRTFSKAVSIANKLNEEHGPIALAGGEEIVRGYLLNSFLVPDAIVNLTDKGSDGFLVRYSAFAAADLNCDAGGRINTTQSRTIARELSKLNPEVIVADIVLPKYPPSRTLAIAENEGLRNLVNGLGMVVYQAAPAYVKIQDANLGKHGKRVSEKKVLEVFKEVTGMLR